MGTIKDQDKIDKMRERLYARNKPAKEQRRPALTKTNVDVKDSWEPAATRPKPHSEQAGAGADAPASDATFTPRTMSTRRKKYRLILVLTGVFIFVVSLVVSSIFFLTGNNTISGENIAVQVNGPIAVGGGEPISLQVGVTNQNTVPIQSATLIVEYPTGFRAVDDEQGDNLFTERIPLDVINSGEAVNIPLKAVVFGEENEEKTINASVEYRVSGSNQVFFKEAQPFTFRVSSAPLVLDIAAVEQLSSGQEVEVAVTLRSNAATPLRNILVSAQYPTGFRFQSADPSPVSGESVWRFTSIEPEESVTIDLSGLVEGDAADQLALQFDAGTADGRSALQIESVLATAEQTFEVEQPFIDVALSVNGETGTVVVPSGQEDVSVSVDIENTLSSSVYDLQVKSALDGTALRDEGVEPGDGFFDSINDEIVWDVTSNRELRELGVDSSVSLKYSLDAASDQQNPSLSSVVDVFARRLEAEQVQEELIGTAEIEVLFSGETQLLADVGRNSATFADSGPVPPVADQETTYTLGLRAAASVNDMEGAVVTAVLPSYVLWREEVTGDGSLTFNPVTRELSWEIGDLSVDSPATASFQVGLIPSVAQVGEEPVLMAEPQFRATDKFTGSRITATTPKITTVLPEEAGYEKDSGVVRTLEGAPAD